MRRPLAVLLALATLVATVTTVTTASASAVVRGTVKGVVTDAAGAPLGGVTVSAWALPTEGGPPQPFSRRVVTSATGRYSIAVPVGSYFVCAGGIVGAAYDDTPPTAEDALHVGECTGGVQPRSIDPFEVTGTAFAVTALSTTTRRLSLDATGRIEGTVRTSGGAPLGGVGVLATEGPSQGSHEIRISGRAVTRADGSYTIDFPVPASGLCVLMNTAPNDPFHATRVRGSDETSCSFDSPRVDAGAPGTVVTGIDASLPAVTRPPVQNVTAPSYEGTPRIGSTVTAQPGTWDASGVTFTYAWFVGGEQVGSGPTLTLDPGDQALVGSPLTLSVTARAPGRRATTVSWASPEAIRLGKIVVDGLVSVSGTPKVGEVLTAEVPSSSPTARVTYQWYRNGVKIAGATSPTYTVVAADLDTRLMLSIAFRTTGYQGVVQATSVSVTP